MGGSNGKSKQESAPQGSSGTTTAVPTQAQGPPPFEGSVEIIGRRNVGRRTFGAVLTNSSYDSWRNTESKLWQANIDGQLIKVTIWAEKDFADPTSPMALARSPRPNVVAQFLIFDVTDSGSFESIRAYLKATKKVLGVQQIIIANKMDVEENFRTVNLEEAKALATSYQAAFVSVSSGKGSSQQVLVAALRPFLTETVKIVTHLRSVGSMK